MSNFLAKIWGQADGFRCVVSGKGMVHNFSVDNDAEIIINRDTWFSPTLFKNPNRLASDAALTKAFWLDIDCGSSKDYQTQHQAGFELKAFCDDLEFPIPSVVSSGNGLHVYWILKEHVTPSEWHPIARALREACIDRNLKADHAVTIDIARILRVPGTKNYKDPKNPKPVEILADNPECNLDEIKEALSEYLFKVELQDAAKDANKNLAIDFPQTPKDANAIADRCPQMARLRSTKGDIPEPEWYAGLGVLALCTDGVLLAHEWSKGYPRYSKRATDKKFERAKEFAPTTCKKFEEVNPDLCRSCPYFGKISSPVQLGESVTPLDVPKSDVPQNPGQIEKRDNETLTKDDRVPKQYLLGKEGVFLYKPATDTTPPEKQFIASQPIWVSRVMVGEDGSGSEIELSWHDAHNRQRKANVRQSLLEKPSEFGAALRDRNISFYGNLREFNYYIQRCIDHVNKRQREEIVYSKFGFTDDDAGFLIGRDLINAKGFHTAHISSRINAKRIEQMDCRGTLDGWKRACSLLDEPQYWPHRFTIIACLGTPLFRVSGNEGSVLSLAGETSGGKTTAANTGIASFADPRAFTIDPTSTIKAFYEHWRQAGNLPLVINEAATIRRDQIGNLIYAAANGKARDGLTQSRELYDSGTWDTLTILTSNTQLLDLPESTINEAGRRRILEIPFLPENCLPLSVGRPVNALIEKNHGHAGREFIKAVLSDPEYVGNKINEHTEKLQNGVHSVHRYNLWLIACASVAADLCTGLGLIDFETADCIENAIQILRNSVKDAPTPKAQIEILISRYTQIYQENIGIKEGSNNGWHREPRGHVMGRVTQTKGEKLAEIAIPCRELKNFALENGVDVNRIKLYMGDRKTKQVRLSTISNPVECWILPHEME